MSLLNLHSEKNRKKEAGTFLESATYGLEATTNRTSDPNENVHPKAVLMYILEKLDVVLWEIFTVLLVKQ